MEMMETMEMEMEMFIIKTNIYICTASTIPRGALQLFAYISGAIWTIQHLTVTLTFKRHWPHDLP